MTSDPFVDMVLSEGRGPFALLVMFGVSALLAPPIARRFGWSTVGTGLSLAAFGATIAGTFVIRLGRQDLVVDSDALRQCLVWTTSAWGIRDSFVNLLLLAPLGFGLYLASGSKLRSTSAVLITALLIESGQAVTRLGVCQPEDVLRNVLGGFAGVALGWAMMRMLGDAAPTWLTPAPTAESSGDESG